jgi:hypothetical protein
LLKEDLVGTPNANNKEDVIDVDALYDGLLALPESRATSRPLHPRDTRHPIPDFFGEIRVSTRYPKPEIP